MQTSKLDSIPKVHSEVLNISRVFIVNEYLSVICRLKITPLPQALGRDEQPVEDDNTRPRLEVVP